MEYNGKSIHLVRSLDHNYSTLSTLLYSILSIDAITFATSIYPHIRSFIIMIEQRVIITPGGLYRWNPQIISSSRSVMVVKRVLGAKKNHPLISTM